MWWRAILLLVACVSNAQADDDPLKGVQAIDVVINVGMDSTKCGYNEQEVRNALLLPIRAYTKIREDEGSAGVPHLLLSMLTVNDAGVCIHAIVLELFTFAFVKLEFAQSPSAHMVQLWRRLKMSVTPVSESGPTVKRKIEDLGKDFASAWQKANP